MGRLTAIVVALAAMFTLTGCGSTVLEDDYTPPNPYEQADPADEAPTDAEIDQRQREIEREVLQRDFDGDGVSAWDESGGESGHVFGQPDEPQGTTCVDVTSYDYNWDNDMRCTRPDGSVFYTDYAGAAAAEAG